MSNGQPQFKHMNHPGLIPWAGVYFHGRAEQFVAQQIQDGSAPDLVACTQPLCEHTLASDNYTVLSTRYFWKDTFEPCTVYGEPAVLALWFDDSPNPWAHGLVFLADDDEARAYALAKFRARPCTI